MLSSTARPQGKDLMEPVFQLGSPLSIQTHNCESQKPLAGAVGARPCAAVAVAALSILGFIVIANNWSCCMCPCKTQ